MISDKLNDQIRNQKDIATVSLGSFNLKNVSRPVEIFSVDAEGIVKVARGEIRHAPVDDKKSIAVLPFVNMSSDAENEYFSDGITEEILNALAKLENLQVTSRTSSFAFKNRNIDVREIGEQLGVKNILEGSVRKAGNKVRITAQLINSADGYHIFSEIYDRDLKDIFEVQDEISNRIANTLKAKLSLEDKDKQLVSKTTTNMEAYNLYLKGVYYYNKWTPEAAFTAIELLEKSLELDPDHASSYVALASCYMMMGAMGVTIAKEAYDKADEYTSRAIELNDQLAEAQMARGFVYFYRNWDLENCRSYIEKAMSLKPGSADVHTAHAMYLLAVGKFDESIKACEKALPLDPLSLPIITSYSYVLLCAGKYEEAVAKINSVLNMDPNFRSAYEMLSWSQFFLGEPEKAIDSLNKFQQLSGDTLRGIGGKGYIYAKTGNVEKARVCLNTLINENEDEQDITLDIEYVILYMTLGEIDKAFEYMERSLNNKIGILAYKTHPFARELNKYGRFNELVDNYKRSTK